MEVIILKSILSHGILSVNIDCCKFYREGIGLQKIIVCLIERQKADAKQQSEDGKRAAWLALERWSGQNEKELQKKGVSLQKEPSGKPVFCGIKAYVSVSHTKGIAAAAVSDEPIGIDIEPELRENLRVAKRMFAPSEQRWLQERQKQGKQGGFAVVWTLREAYAKWTGKGLAKMPQVCFAINEEQVLCSDENCCAQTKRLTGKEKYRFSLVQSGKKQHETAIFWEKENF